MAITKCKECGAQVSTKAESCPQCGAKVKKRSGCGLLLLLLVVVVIVGASINSQLGGGKRAASPKVELSDADKARISAEAEKRAQHFFGIRMINDVEQAVRQSMKDPDSTKFQDTQYANTKETGSVVFGYVNSKNSFGAYTGFQRFISNGKTILLEQNDPKVMELWRKLQAAVTTTRTLETLSSGSPLMPAVIDLRAIVGKSEKEVETLLGAPTKIEKIPEGRLAKYDDKKLEIIYDKDRVEWITVNGLAGIPFSPDAIDVLGMERVKPTFASEHVMRWTEISGIKEIAIFRGKENCDYVLVRVIGDVP